MKKYVPALVASISLSACGGTPMTMALETAPGKQMPGGISVCKERGEFGRCLQWSSPGDMCVNPKGYIEPVILPCPKNKEGKPIPFK